MTADFHADFTAKRSRDPALILSVVVIWALMALFIVFPLAKILVLTF